MLKKYPVVCILQFLLVKIIPHVSATRVIKTYYKKFFYYSLMWFLCVVATNCREKIVIKIF